MIIVKTILLKISGELLAGCSPQTAVNAGEQGALMLASLAEQMHALQKTHRFALVVGGGNFFRARQARASFKLRQPVADAVGMLATVMNGLMLQEFFMHCGITCSLLSAVDVTPFTRPINQSSIDELFAAGHSIIFCGGLGNPFFTTDTTAVVRALQIGADEVWKATNVDYIYEQDPRVAPSSRPLVRLSTQEYLSRQLQVMDHTAVLLAQQHALTIRVFNVHEPQALVRVSHDEHFGSTLYCE
ncbi:MAG: Uridylate kinase [candidate division TM6 bacterium GW2011_GWF2_38_10]|nr:MAG: Uridylate kinase [candidate division TM6 bacterium GW2011_GWF2_38_10]